MVEDNKIMDENLKISKDKLKKLSRFHSPDYDLMYQLLRDMKKIFDFHGIKWCCCFGTLLGAIRDGDFAGMIVDGIFKRHDYDIDIAVFEKDKRKFQIAFNDFSKLGYDIFLLNMAPTVISKKNEWIDLWLFGKTKENKNYIACGGFPFHKRFFKEFKTAKIKNIEVLVPNFAEEFLELLYGPDWRKPNPKEIADFLHDKELYDKLMARMEKGI